MVENTRLVPADTFYVPDLTVSEQLRFNDILSFTSEEAVLLLQKISFFAQVGLGPHCRPEI